MAKHSRLRQKQIGILSRIIAKYSQPRVQLFLILLLTASVGAGASFVLLKSGLTGMWLRYPLAAVIAYLTFLALLRLWVQHRFCDINLPPDSSSINPEPGNKSKRSAWSLRLLDFLDVVTVVDDLPIAILFIAVIIIIVVVLGIIIAAPVLMAEVLLDGLLVAGLWHRFERYGKESSLSGTVRATVLPAVIVVVCLGVIGFILQMIAPGADSIGDVFRD